MDYGQMVMILSRLAFGAAATFLAIVLWSNTRDLAWMFIVIGTILRYGEVMYSTLGIFGIVQSDLYIIWGIPVVKMVFQNLPDILFIVAFSVIILRNRIRIEAVTAKMKKGASSEDAGETPAEITGKEKRKKQKKEKKSRKGRALPGDEAPVPTGKGPKTEGEAAEEPEELGEPVEVEEVEEVGEVESVEEPEELGEPVEVEEVEEVGEVESVEEPEELGEPVEVEEVEEVGEVEEVEEIESEK